VVLLRSSDVRRIGILHGVHIRICVDNTISEHRGGPIDENGRDSAITLRLRTLHPECNGDVTPLTTKQQSASEL
jgi:hypothetical protein